MKVYYFTATGNSLYVAKYLANNTISIPQAIKNNDYNVTGDVIGFVVPTYYGKIPNLVFEFISEMKINADYVFAIMTCGDDNSSGISDFTRFLQKNKTYVEYSKVVYMTCNHIPLKNLKDELKIDKNVQSQLERIKRDIDNRLDFKMESNLKGGIKRNILTVINKIMPLDKASNFSINENCVKCEICTKVCPRKNIVFKNNKINIGKECEHCLACIHNCPKKAIDIKNDKSPNIRYRNENISLSEIVNANNQR